MWAAVGEPERKPRWEHLGILKVFIRGTWFDPGAGRRGPGLFEPRRFAVRRLYDLRLRADYRLDRISYQEAQWAVDIAQEIIALAEQEGIDNGPADEKD